jgi:site-specific recombinase XerD
MAITNVIVNYRRFLKRRNYSLHTVKNYMNILRHFVLWVNVPIEEVGRNKIAEYTDHLLYKRLKPKTINCHLACIRVFYDYLHHEEGMGVNNPIKRGSSLRMPRPLPKHLRDEEVVILFNSIKKPRDQAIFRIMLRCGLRVDEVANLYISDLDLKRNKIFVRNGKGRKDRVVYVSRDAYEAIVNYFKVRPMTKTKKLFLVEKGPYLGKPVSVRGIQKRIEYYSRITGIDVSCHQLRHTMATQMLNADAEVETIQDLLGHNGINTTERYCSVSNLKVMRDYFKAMEVIMHRTVSGHLDDILRVDKNKKQEDNKAV